MAGAKVESVIGVDAIGYGGKTARVRQFIQGRKQFVFAKITTVGGVGAVSEIIHFVCFDELVAQAGVAH